MDAITKAKGHELLQLVIQEQMPIQQLETGTDGLRSRFSFGKGHPFRLEGVGVDYFDQLLDLLANDPSIGTKFSRAYLDRAITDLMATSPENLEDARRALDRLLDRLESFIDSYTVMVPVMGISLRVDSLQVGHVILKTLEKQNYDVLWQRLRGTVAQNDQYDETDRRHTIENLEQEMLRLKGSVIAEHEVVAEPERARERAVEETRRALDLLTLAIARLYPPDRPPAIGLQGEIATGTRITPIIGTTTEAFLIHYDFVGANMPFEVSDNTVRDMAKMGIFKASEMLQREAVSAFEETLLYVIRLFAEAQSQVDNQIKLLHLIICLEAFLYPRRSRARIAASITNSLIQLFKPDAPASNELRRRLANIFAIRSRLVHGTPENISDDDVTYLNYTVLAVIFEMIERSERYGSAEDLLSELA